MFFDFFTHLSLTFLKSSTMNHQQTAKKKNSDILVLCMG